MENEIEDAEFTSVPTPEGEPKMETKAPEQPKLKAEEQVAQNLVLFITQIVYPQDPKNPTNINLVGSYCQQANLIQFLVEFAKKYQEENK